MVPNTSELAPHARVLGALSGAEVTYTIRRHSDCLWAIRTPYDFARCLARPVDAITKALFLDTGDDEPSRRYAIAVCPVPYKIDFRGLARLLGARHLALAAPEALAAQLDFAPNGVSPLGCAPFAVMVEEAVFAHPTVLVGSGVPAVEIELTPDDLLRASGGTRVLFARM